MAMSLSRDMFLRWLNSLKIVKKGVFGNLIFFVIYGYRTFKERKSFVIFLNVWSIFLTFLKPVDWLLWIVCASFSLRKKQFYFNKSSASDISHVQGPGIMNYYMKAAKTTRTLEKLVH